MPKWVFLNNPAKAPAMTNNEITNTRADLAGMQLALGSAIRALIKTHPDPVAVRSAMLFEHEETLAHLTAGLYPDRALEAFHAAWRLLGPSDQDAA